MLIDAYNAYTYIDRAGTGLGVRSNNDQLQAFLDTMCLYSHSQAGDIEIQYCARHPHTKM